MITIQHIEPIPLLPDEISAESNIWRSNQEFIHGKRYLVIAPSGKGKSTFLHILYGLRSDFNGTVLHEGKDSKSFSLDVWADLRQESLSLVFQDLRLFPDLTALENILLQQQLHPKIDEQQIRGMAERLGVEGLLDRKASTLSYGQQQRMALIRSLARPFKMLLLDEPFSHLDQANTQIAIELINEAVKREQAGVILVSLGEHYDMDWDVQLIL